MRMKWHKPVLFLALTSIFMFHCGCKEIYNPKKNRKEQQKVRQKEASKHDRVVNKGY